MFNIRGIRAICSKEYLNVKVLRVAVCGEADFVI